MSAAGREVPLDVAALLDGPWVVVPTFQTMHGGARLPTFGIQASGLWLARLHPLGPEPDRQALVRRHALLFAASKEMAVLLREAVEAFAPALNDDTETSAASLLERLSGWLEQARAVLAQVDGP